MDRETAKQNAVFSFGERKIFKKYKYFYKKTKIGKNNFFLGIKGKKDEKMAKMQFYSTYLQFISNDKSKKV